MPDYAMELAQFTGIKKTSIHGLRRTVSSQLNTILFQKAVADMLGHSERVNEQHYNYSTAENTEKAAALLKVSSERGIWSPLPLRSALTGCPSDF